MSEPMKIKNTSVNLVLDDLTAMDVESFVFYADHNLKISSGYGTAITQRGGQSIQKEIEPLGPLQTTDVVVSEAGKLKAAHIFHAVGPRFQEEDIPGKLKQTMLNTLKAADEKGVKKVAFPAMGTGFFGVPLPTCVDVMLASVKEYLSTNNTQLTELTVCCLDNREMNAFKDRWSTLKQA